MGGLFGTDGVRGVANKEVTPELAFNLGRAGARFLSAGRAGAAMVLGRDTRLSGDMLSGALMAGINSVGVDVVSVGIIPTPAVALLSQKQEYCGGVMLSASHNPIEDNGIKFFSGSGYKLSDDQEQEIEQLIQSSDLPRPMGDHVGRFFLQEDALERYAQMLAESIDCDLSGLKVVVDCACGAAFQAAPFVYRQLGASVIAINDTPDGSRINVECGSTDTGMVKKLVKATGADLGIAHDGDADRVILIDERGEERDGDYVMAICGSYLQERGELSGQRVVATAYSNLGLQKALEQGGVKLELAQNGDRYVLEMMLEKGYVLGGEQSGHIIFLNHNTTGDGLLTALKVMEVMQKKEESLSSLSGILRKYPQVLKNASVSDKDWEEVEAIQSQIEAGEKRLAGRGRIHVRASGTEPVIRVMVEGPDADEIEEIASGLVGVIEGQLG